MHVTGADKQRLAEIFGDDPVDAGPTSDDAPEPGERSDRDDAWWQAQRPPHHEG